MNWSRLRPTDDVTVGINDVSAGGHDFHKQLPIHCSLALVWTQSLQHLTWLHLQNHLFVTPFKSSCNRPSLIDISWFPTKMANILQRNNISAVKYAVCSQRTWWWWFNLFPIQRCHTYVDFVPVDMRILPSAIELPPPLSALHPLAALLKCFIVCSRLRLLSAHLIWD